MAPRFTPRLSTPAALAQFLSPAAAAQIATQVEACRAAIRVRKWSLATERCYCAWIRRYGTYLATTPEARAMPDSAARVSAFLRSLVAGATPRSATTLNQALNALVFHYAHVRHEPLGKLRDLPLEAGVDVRTVQDLLGHADVSTTMIYTHTAARSQLVRNAINSIL